MQAIFINNVEHSKKHIIKLFLEIAKLISYIFTP